MRRAALIVLAGCATVALFAPFFAPNDPGTQFADRAFAPPMLVHVHDASGWHRPFVRGLAIRDRLMKTFNETAPHALRWITGGTLVSLPDDEPLLLLGGDALGRDVFSRLLYGARLSLGVTFLGTAGALLVGAIVGGLAGTLGGRRERWLMAAADVVLVLPTMYVVLVLRAALPLVVTPGEVFALMALIFAAAAWPHVARGVRAIVAAERQRDYAEAARAAGAGTLRLVGHLLPAARGFLIVEAVLLLPALLSAEATISFLGLGFPEPDASWGTMLQDAAKVSNMTQAPWMLAPAAALFVVVLAVQVAGRKGDPPLQSSNASNFGRPSVRANIRGV